tara:strand:- start:226 stop:408 length:183 start_codon:yes stop_codon:yes gene_type:complete
MSEYTTQLTGYNTVKYLMRRWGYPLEDAIARVKENSSITNNDIKKLRREERGKQLELPFK